MHECPHDGTPAFGCSACYGHLKAAIRSGADLTPDELEFIGVGVSRRRDTSGGWRDASQLVPSFELTSDDLSAEDRDVLASLMGHRDGVEFMGL